VVLDIEPPACSERLAGADRWLVLTMPNRATAPQPDHLLIDASQATPGLISVERFSEIPEEVLLSTIDCAGSHAVMHVGADTRYVRILNQVAVAERGLEVGRLDGLALMEHLVSYAEVSHDFDLAVQEEISSKES
jgi:hypothetical protein